jgi:hypothetical protein
VRISLEIGSSWLLRRLFGRETDRLREQAFGVRDSSMSI